ncbi:ribbon-helix-helix protein [Aerococcus urinaeequi]|uniref:ribbon-helix-helix protein n=1 Tax=Aerococcus urinaeequi TaxID=51665 RepID=UPI003D6A6225
MEKKGFGTNVGRKSNNKDIAKKTVLKSIRVSEQAHKQLRLQSVKEDKSIRELIDELLDID